MSWLAITEELLKKHFSSTELETYRAAAVADGETDPIAQVISNITNRVRASVASCPQNVVDSDSTTIPDELLGAACDLIAWEIMKRPGGVMMDPEGARELAYKEALKLLTRVEDCRFRIENPVTGDASGVAVQEVNSETRTATRSSMDGL
ncbi:MAG: hypothetical protein JXR37_09250 [Kiritimatiellae bacterium]|nr:hypothetical protein [Kiritimatiellia bacterium]